MNKKRDTAPLAKVVAAGATDIVFREDKAAGKEIWQVPSHGKIIVTTTTSGATMDEALERYAGALERLAKK
mgnify:CR=1 FL=1